jgi:site-specific DNA recombinase
MIVQHTVNSRGAEYTYFFCRNRQNGTCQAPHINVALIEDVVETHYATIRFSAHFIAEVRAHIAQVIDEQEAAERLLHEQLTTELRALDTREENLIELAADATIRQPKIKAKLREITGQRRRLTVFVYLHAAGFALWMLLVEPSPWPTLTFTTIRRSTRTEFVD